MLRSCLYVNQSVYRKRNRSWQASEPPGTTQRVTCRPESARWGGTSYKNAPTNSVSVGGTRFVYRELGIDSGVPVIFLNHLAANLDNWDPRGRRRHRGQARGDHLRQPRAGRLARARNRDLVEAMAQDAVAFIRALGFDRVDLLGFSLGGFVSQVIAEQEPAPVRKMILAGTGPAGGEGIVNVTKLSYLRHTARLRDLQGPQGTAVLHPNRLRQVAGQSVHQTLERTHQRPGQGNDYPGIPHPTQGNSRLGPCEAGRPVRYPASGLGGQRR